MYTNKHNQEIALTDTNQGSEKGIPSPLLTPSPIQRDTLDTDKVLVKKPAASSSTTVQNQSAGDTA